MRADVVVIQPVHWGKDDGSSPCPTFSTAWAASSMDETLTTESPSGMWPLTSSQFSEGARKMLARQHFPGAFGEL